jgi:hypothetical protein
MVMLVSLPPKMLHHNQSVFLLFVAAQTRYLVPAWAKRSYRHLFVSYSTTSLVRCLSQLGEWHPHEQPQFAMMRPAEQLAIGR